MKAEAICNAVSCRFCHDYLMVRLDALLRILYGRFQAVGC